MNEQETYVCGLAHLARIAVELLAEMTAEVETDSESKEVDQE